MSPDLSAALDEVARVFAGRTCPADTVCTHCYPPDGIVELAAPGEPIDLGDLSSVAYKSPFSVSDHDALLRRILPQLARGMADGSVHVFWPGQHALARGGWRSWPEEQTCAIKVFTDAWWRDVVTTEAPRHDVSDAFETYVAITRDLRGALDVWPTGPVAEAHLAAVSDAWLDDLVRDDMPLYWLDEFEGFEGAHETIRRWYVDTGASRLRAAGANGLADRADLLALDIDERIARLYGPSPD